MTITNFYQINSYNDLLSKILYIKQNIKNFTNSKNLKFNLCYEILLLKNFEINLQCNENINLKNKENLYEKCFDQLHFIIKNDLELVELTDNYNELLDKFNIHINLFNLNLNDYYTFQNYNR